MAESANRPAPPYYAVIFTSQRHTGDDGYRDMDERLDRLVHAEPGFLGIESVRAADGAGVTVSYWDSLESIRRWKQQAEHLVAQRFGRERWYASYRVRVCRVEREYGFEAGR
jgi:heme-degrading monooxygenase HmoA